MKKLKLDLAQVQVFSLAVATTNGGSGTVNGHNANTDFDADVLYTVRSTECHSCPYCDWEPIGP